MAGVILSDVVSLTPVVVDFVGDAEILQGADTVRVVRFLQSMVAFDPAVTPGAVLRGSVVSSDFATTHLTSEAAAIAFSWADDRTLEVLFTAAGTTLANAFEGAIWQCEAKNGVTGKIERIAQGLADMSRESTLGAT